MKKPILSGKSFWNARFRGNKITRLIGWILLLVAILLSVQVYSGVQIFPFL